MLPAAAQEPAGEPEAGQGDLDRERPTTVGATGGALDPADRSEPQDTTAADAVAGPGQRSEVPEETGEGIEPPATPAVEEEGRPSFTLPVSEERGGGTATGRADELEFVRESYVAARGRVEIHYQDVDLAADEVEYDLTTNTATATGHVVLDQGPRRITAESAVFRFDSKTGEFARATGYVAPDYYFRGAQVAKVGEDAYTVTDGVLTSCEGDSPSWSFRLGHARVDVGGYARVRHVSMRVKELPVLYTPYIVWPAKTERTSGLLIPEVGYSERRGQELGLAYYQVLGRSFDTTLHFDAYSEGYLGFGNELRYRPSDGTAGNVIGYLVRDPEAEEAAVGLDEWRWKVDWYHQTEDLPWGLRGVVSYHDFSDFEFFRDFERDFDRNTLRSLESSGFVTGHWGPHSLNVLVNDRETFFGLAAGGEAARTISQAKLPEAEYRLRPTKLGPLPVYLQALSSVSLLSVDRQRNYNDSYGRVDLFPQLTLPVRAAPWLSLSLSGGGRATWYSDSIFSDADIAQLPPDEQERALNESRFRGEALTRAVPFAGAEIVGPSVSRIYDGRVGPFARFKHVVEPRFGVSWLGEFDETGRVPNFDEVDDLTRTLGGFGRSTQSGRWSLVNRLLAKPAAEDGGAAREILSFEVGQEVSFDDDQPLQRSLGGATAQEGPISTLLRFSPSLETSFKAQVDYSGFFSNLVRTSLSGNHRVDRANVAATWFTRYNAETGEAFSDQVRFYGGLDVLRDRLRIESQVNYDLELALLQQQSYVLHWSSQCYALRFEMRDFRAGNRRDTEYFLSFSLKNVGTFVPLTARTTTTLP